MDYDNLHEITDMFKIIQMMEILYLSKEDMTPFLNVNLGMASAENSTDIFFRIIEHLFEITEVSSCSKYHGTMEMYNQAALELDYWLESIHEYDSVDYIVILDDRFTSFAPTSGGGYYTSFNNASHYEIFPTDKGMVILYDTEEGFPDFGEMLHHILSIFSSMSQGLNNKETKEEKTYEMAL